LLLFAASAHAADSVYRLPWPEGLTFRFERPPGGLLVRHPGPEARYAVDISMPVGTAVLAAREGMVQSVEARMSRHMDPPPTKHGNFVRIRHADGSVALYAHLRQGGVVVKPGEWVARGQLLGYSGATGNTVDPLLHFCVTQPSGAGAPADVPVPFRFTVGVPPIEFTPRASEYVRANYSSRAEPPYSTLDPSRGYAPPPPLAPEERRFGLIEIAGLVAAGLAGLAWLGRRS